ncbi:unnamed protein product [Mucor hiemalis]
MNESVGNLIKNAAKALHKKVASGIELSSRRERKIMSNGLSSILDLNDSSMNSQISLFNDHSGSKRSFICCSDRILHFKKSQTIEQGLLYINKVYYKTEKSNRYIIYIYDHMLKCLTKYPNYLSKNMVQIFGLSVLQIATHLSSTENKSQMYSDSPNVKGFKIDIRVVYHLNGADYDLLNGEVASYDGDEKIIMNEGKLTREGKEIQDTLVRSGCSSLFPWICQHVGSNIDVSTFHLTALGLYVALPRFGFSLSSTITDIITMGQYEGSYVVDMSMKLKRELSPKFENSKPLGKTSYVANVSEKLYWVRETYFTPPRDQSSKEPDNMYGVHAPANILSKLLKASFEGQDEETSVDACEFGWVEKGEKYFNLYTKEYKDEHVCC